MPRHTPVPGPTQATAPVEVDLTQTPAAICASYRKSVGTSQRRFAAALDMDPALLSKIEAGQRALSRRSAILLAQTIANGTALDYDHVLGALMPASAALG